MRGITHVPKSLRGDIYVDPLKNNNNILVLVDRQTDTNNNILVLVDRQTEALL
jgi:hypothetical protein